MRIDNRLTLKGFKSDLENFFEKISAPKILRLNRSWKPADGSPVITRRGVYTSRAWTEWTQGFQFGCQLLQFDATGEEKFLQMGRKNTFEKMSGYITHTGVHDHGFNIVTTFGNLRRLALEGAASEADLAAAELALKVSGAVQAARWTAIADGTGYIYSFNGPHSLFADTVRSCRAVVLSHLLGHFLLTEGDRRINLLHRAVEHLTNNSRYNVYFGKGRDLYDLRGRVAHESLFNINNGTYRCPSTQQGYSPFSTWTRGLSWVILGYAEQLEFFSSLPEKELKGAGGRKTILDLLKETATATADFYLANTPRDGIPYWDTSAPGLHHLGKWRSDNARIDNPYEPVDSSAAAITAQGLLRLGRCLGNTKSGRRYFQAGLTIARTLLAEPYLSTSSRHQGLLLHSLYHRPRGWDYIPRGKKVPMGESSLWGDYHLMELAVLLWRHIQNKPCLTFFS